MNYFDTSYLARLYLEDNGWEKVRELAAKDQIACSVHGKAETVAAFHRKFREGSLGDREFQGLLREFERECEEGAFQWLAMSNSVVERAVQAYTTLDATVHLRAADSLHLACAAENQFRQIYSNDVRLLASAAHFGLAGINIL